MKSFLMYYFYMDNIALEQQNVFLAKLGQSQLDRLAYIEFKIYFFGTVGRSDLMNRFGIGSAGATRDFAAYKALAPINLQFDNSTKNYLIGENFSPVFEHLADRVMTALSQGFGDGIKPASDPLVTCETPPPLNRLKIEILAPLSRAIHLGKVANISYFSGSSGLSRREIVPFAFATDGLRWHVRAFDRKRGAFLDFVLSRMDDVFIADDTSPKKNEVASQDNQWNRIVEMDLVPHPLKESAELVRRDFGMVDGVLRLKMRAAMAGYILQQWHVDCSSDHHIEDKAYRLWLRDPLVLYGVESAVFAPSYGKVKSALKK